MSSDTAPSEARRTTNSNEYATPQPPRSYAGSSLASTSTRTLNQASSSSLAGQAAAQSSPGTMRATSASQITVESSLALANGSYEIALAQVVEERNTIYNQNTMLWKHVEKTKSAATGYKKDLERIRAERDRALVRIQHLTGEETRPRAVAQRNASIDALPPTHTERPRQPIRHLSDAGPQSPPSGVYHILISKTGSNVSSGSINESPSPKSQAMAANDSRPSLSSAQPSDSSIPFVAEGRGHQEPPTVSTSIIPPTPTRRSQTDPTATSRSSPQLSTPTNAPQRDPTSRPRVESSPVHAAEGSHHQTPSHPLLMPSVSSANTLTPKAAGAVDPHKLSRDSRITLPDETSRYLNYNHLIESPIGSPGSMTMVSNAQRDGSVPSSPLRGVTDASQENEPPVPGPSKTAAPSASPSGEFLDLDTTDDGEYAGDSSQEAVATQPQPHPVPANTPQQQQQPTYGKGGTVPSGSGVPPPRPPRRARSSDVVESSHLSLQGSSVEPVPPPEERVSSDATARSVNGAGSSASSTAFGVSSQAHSNYAPQTMPPPHQPEQQWQQQQYSRPSNSQQQQQQQQQQGSPPAPANTSSSDLPRFEYKSAKLTNDDLPHTVIRVDGSTIRSNDRGKEVLSFLIGVSVKGKEPWKVEKLYSDVLALDGRIRVGAGKTQGKKIASLPDNKLFKDNAPAKVDQRKIALEVYFQSLVLANLKTRDDVCMFFSTGIIRPEREPVHQLGHKEGYLTKRSKNFGGCARRSQYAADYELNVRHL